MLITLLPSTLAAGGLGEPTTTVRLPFDTASRSLVRFTNHHFLTFDRPSATISVISPEGLLQPDLRLTDIPDVTGVTIRTIALSPEGLLVASAACYSANSQVVSALIWVDQARKTTRVVRTSPYSVLALAFATDGTLWTVGREKDPGHAVVRQFDKTGKMIQSLLPVETFKAGKLVSHPAELVEMVPTTGGGMGMFVPGSSEWIDITSSGHVTRQTLPIPSDGNYMVPGVGLAQNGDPILTVQPTSGSGATRVVRYQKSDGQLVTIQECETRECQWSRIAGVDNDKLVIAGPRSEFGWFAIP
jgi:hypothetical protein